VWGEHWGTEAEGEKRRRTRNRWPTHVNPASEHTTKASYCDQNDGGDGSTPIAVDFGERGREISSSLARLCSCMEGIK
jgi:hypothetical protein